PTRIVEIQDTDKVRLYQTQGERDAYTCLSHCWGSNPIIQTTSSTLSTFKNSIPWSQLSRTFRDAIDLTYRLGLKYIWIDSLCIIQDNIDDWRHEGNKMASTYSNSFLTIAASKARDGNEGCYSTCPPELCKNLPLLQRGWVLQERLLSPRVVHFGPRELYWECAQRNLCECSELSLILNLHGGGVGTKDLKRELSRSGLTLKDQWYSIVTEYSKLHLTFEKDIFPALQGLAVSTQRHTLFAYHAGLWEDTLISDLMWIPKRQGRRPRTWRAPTWSWASVVG
ncbi:HET-domain-containing protein, partial [Lindgomyces ingoldianus]